MMAHAMSPWKSTLNSCLIQWETVMRTRELQKWVRLVGSPSWAERAVLRAEIAA